MLFFVAITDCMEFECLFFYRYSETDINNFVALTETVEVGCPRHPGATTIGNQLQDGDRTDGWQKLTTQP